MPNQQLRTWEDHPEKGHWSYAQISPSRKNLGSIQRIDLNLEITIEPDYCEIHEGMTLEEAKEFVAGEIKRRKK